MIYNRTTIQESSKSLEEVEKQTVETLARRFSNDSTFVSIMILNSFEIKDQFPASEESTDFIRKKRSADSDYDLKFHSYSITYTTTFSGGMKIFATLQSHLQAIS